MLAGLELHVEVLPEQRVVRFEPVRSRGDFPGEGLAEHERTDVVAIKTHDDLAVLYIIGMHAGDSDPGGRGAHVFIITARIIALVPSTGMRTLIGIHAVAEALKAGRPLDRVHVAKGAGGHRMQDILSACRTNRVPVRWEERSTLDRLSAGGVHQGVVAIGAESDTRDLAELMPGASMLVVLDGIEDPHNLGAVARSAHAAGASGLVIPERRAAGLTPSAAKAAAGALEYLPVARVGNINRALEQMKEAGFWIYGLDERGQQAYDEVTYTPPSVLVVGAEGKGLHEQVRKHCDFLVRIPLAGQLSSLNVSVAAGIALFEWKRRRAS